MEAPAKGTVASISSMFLPDEALSAVKHVQNSITNCYKELEHVRDFIAENNNVIYLVQRFPNELHHDIMIHGKFLGPMLEMGSKALQAAKVYRQVLKAAKKHIGGEEYKRHFRDFVTQEFRKNDKLGDRSSILQKINLARDYTFLLNSVHHHKDLLFSYNIAVDRSDEMKRVLGKSAASVGLQLPEVYQA